MVLSGVLFCEGVLAAEPLATSDRGVIAGSFSWFSSSRRCASRPRAIARGVGPGGRFSLHVDDLSFGAAEDRP
eukprot:76578-Lingulodinium_polyedra.AAC.1